MILTTVPPQASGAPGSGLRWGWLCVATALLVVAPAHGQSRPRAREVGVAPGLLPTGPLNAITDVPGVLVGQTTVIRGDSIRTGVTAILPHGGNLYRDRVPAAVFVINGFGKLIGTTQLHELGELETPILLTCTLCVWKAADAMVAHLLPAAGHGGGPLHQPRGRRNQRRLPQRDPCAPHCEHGCRRRARRPPATARSRKAAWAPGTGTIALGWKGGIGTSSRRVRLGDSTWTVGVLVQTNFGGSGGLILMGVPVGRLLGRDGLSGATAPRGPTGSIMIVVATDAPLSDRNLERLASRADIGLGRTGATAGNGSGDYVIAFSTNAAVRRPAGGAWLESPQLGNDVMSALFAGVIEATEEAIDNALFAATTVTGNGHTVEALPLAEVLALLRDRKALAPPLPVAPTSP